MASAAATATATWGLRRTTTLRAVAALARRQTRAGSSGYWPAAAGRKRRLAGRFFSSSPRPTYHDSDDDVRMVAAAADGTLAIGRGGQLPWELPEDRRHFFHLTHGHILVLGRRSYEELGHALPGRTTVVVSRTIRSLPDVHVAPSLPDALALARRLKSSEKARRGGPPMAITWIGGRQSRVKERICDITIDRACGGHDLYAEAMAMPPGALSRCRLLYLTRVHIQGVQGDAFFPSGWPAHFPQLLWSCPSSRHPCTYEIYA